MTYNFITNIEACYVDLPQLLYYSHIPTSITALLLGLFVYIKSKTLVSRILFLIAIAFSLWCAGSLLVWMGHDSRLIMFVWSFFGLISSLIYISSLYFFYVFVDKKDISLRLKIIFGILILPVIVLLATRINLPYFDNTYCESSEGQYYVAYYYILGLITSIWILVLAFMRYRKADLNFKKQIILLTVGMELFLLAFSMSGFLASYLANQGIDAFQIEQYGLFGMTFFMAVLAFMIVKFKVFNIKLIGAQALVIALVILIASQFFFIRNNTNRILTGITLALALGFGYMLIKSIKMEVKRKEELQEMSNQLAGANDQLRKLDNAKSEFISIASHQLRTPLTAIKGFVSLLLEGSYGQMSAEIKEVLNKVYISNERLVELVEDMLNLSRIESGRMEYKFEKTNLPDLLQEVYDTFAIRAKERGLKLEMSVPEGQFPEVETDRSKIREVISNLVDNGLKYTEKGLVKIKLIDAGENVRVGITDTGIGVPQSEIPYLFSKFSRGKDINRLNTGGTGLGLHVGKKMIEALHGRIWVESQGAGLGSTFFIEVPKVGEGE